MTAHQSLGPQTADSATSISRRVLAEIWRAAGHPEAALDAIDLTGTEPVLPSSFAVGTAAQTTIAAAALAAGELWRLRTGRRQGVSVDIRDAAIEFRSERYLRVDGRPPSEYHDQIAGLYRCGDGRWVRLHTNLPHHRDGVLALLGCSHDRMAVQRALDGWHAEAFETAAADAGLVVTACRSFPEWDEHPQGRAIARLPLFAIDQIGDAAAQPLPAADRPLAGVKVLDLTRIIAGPVCGRTLAAHGADVLLITASHLPAMEPLVIDTGRGKLSTYLDLRQTSGRETLASLLRDTDIFVQGYRPGAIAAFGFGPQDVARIRPGIVYVSLCAYGQEGPMGRPARVRLAGTDGQRLQCRRSGGFWCERAETPAGASARPRHRLPDGVRGDVGAGAACRARRELARSDLARTDRLLASPSRTHRWHDLPRSRFR